jgi:hypothetical protein
MENRFVRLVNAVRWRNHWRGACLAALVGAIIVSSSAEGLRTIIPALASEPSPLPNNNDASKSKLPPVTSNHQEGGQTGATINNNGPVYNGTTVIQQQTKPSSPDSSGGNGIYMAPGARGLTVTGGAVICGNKNGIEMHGSDVHIDGGVQVYRAEDCSPPPYKPTGRFSSLSNRELKALVFVSVGKLRVIDDEDGKRFMADPRHYDVTVTDRELETVVPDIQEEHAEIVGRLYTAGIQPPAPSGSAEFLFYTGKRAGIGLKQGANYLEEISERLQ